MWNGSEPDRNKTVVSALLILLKHNLQTPASEVTGVKECFNLWEQVIFWEIDIEISCYR